MTLSIGMRGQPRGSSRILGKPRLDPPQPEIPSVLIPSSTSLRVGQQQEVRHDVLKHPQGQENHRLRAGFMNDLDQPNLRDQVGSGPVTQLAVRTVPVRQAPVLQNGQHEGMRRALVIRVRTRPILDLITVHCQVSRRQSVSIEFGVVRDEGGDRVHRPYVHHASTSAIPCETSARSVDASPPRRNVTSPLSRLLAVEREHHLMKDTAAGVDELLAEAPLTARTAEAGVRTSCSDRCRTEPTPYSALMGPPTFPGRGCWAHQVASE